MNQLQERSERRNVSPMEASKRLFKDLKREGLDFFVPGQHDIAVIRADGVLSGISASFAIEYIAQGKIKAAMVAGIVAGVFAVITMFREISMTQDNQELEKEMLFQNNRRA